MKLHFAALAALANVLVISAQQDRWYQCGGQDWKGGTSCITPGWTCQKQNDYYSQCLPGPTGSGSVTTAPPPAPLDEDEGEDDEDDDDGSDDCGEGAGNGTGETIPDIDTTQLANTKSFLQKPSNPATINSIPDSATESQKYTVSNDTTDYVGSDPEGSDTQGSDTQGSDTAGSDTEGQGSGQGETESNNSTISGNLATTTLYGPVGNDAGACGCQGTWQNGEGIFTTAAGGPSIYGAGDGYCNEGCGKCYKLTNTGKGACDGDECGVSDAQKGKSIYVMVTNHCPPGGQWCAVGKNYYGFDAHFDLARDPGWGNVVVSYERSNCPGSMIAPYKQCVSYSKGRLNDPALSS